MSTIAEAAATIVPVFRRSATIGAFAAALAKAQGEMGSAKKNAMNPHFGKPYADLEAIVEVSRTPLSKNSIAVTHEPLVTAAGAGVVCELLHSSGEWKSCELILPLQARTAQGVGSAITYAKRYALASLLNIPTGEGEDDGNKATDDAPKNGQETPATGKRTGNAGVRAQLSARVAKSDEPEPAQLIQDLLKKYRLKGDSASGRLKAVTNRPGTWDEVKAHLTMEHYDALKGSLQAVPPAGYVPEEG